MSTVFRMPEVQLFRTIQAHSPQSTCVCVSLSPDGNRFAIGASDAICSVWLTQDLICEYNITRLFIIHYSKKKFSSCRQAEDL